MKKKQASDSTTPLPVRRADRRNGETGNGAGRQSIRQAGRRTQTSPHQPASEEQTGKENEGTGKQREDEPDGIEWQDIAARNR